MLCLGSFILAEEPRNNVLVRHTSACNLMAIDHIEIRGEVWPKNICFTKTYRSLWRPQFFYKDNFENMHIFSALVKKVLKEMDS